MELKSTKGRFTVLLPSDPSVNFPDARPREFDNGCGASTADRGYVVIYFKGSEMKDMTNQEREAFLEEKVKGQVIGIDLGKFHITHTPRRGSDGISVS